LISGLQKFVIQLNEDKEKRHYLYAFFLYKLIHKYQDKLLLDLIRQLLAQFYLQMYKMSGL
ncbi:hypothetical protein P9W86_24970, partial [Bacillus cereus]|nr:hypothetical protein [Bacillus cereus]